MEECSSVSGIPQGRMSDVSKQTVCLSVTRFYDSKDLSLAEIKIQIKKN